jgi:hypothetical protein
MERERNHPSACLLLLDAEFVGAAAGRLCIQVLSAPALRANGTGTGGTAVNLLLAREAQNAFSVLALGAFSSTPLPSGRRSVGHAVRRFLCALSHGDAHRCHWKRCRRLGDSAGSAAGRSALCGPVSGGCTGFAERPSHVLHQQRCPHPHPVAQSRYSESGRRLRRPAACSTSSCPHVRLSGARAPRWCAPPGRACRALSSRARGSG